MSRIPLFLLPLPLGGIAYATDTPPQLRWI